MILFALIQSPSIQSEVISKTNFDFNFFYFEALNVSVVFFLLHKHSCSHTTTMATLAIVFTIDYSPLFFFLGRQFIASNLFKETCDSHFWPKQKMK